MVWEKSTLCPLHDLFLFSRPRCEGRSMHDRGEPCSQQYCQRIICIIIWQLHRSPFSWATPP